MANTKSAKKMIRKIAKKTANNKAFKSKFRTLVNKIEKAITLGDKQGALKEFRSSQPTIHRAVNKKIYNINKVSRVLSKLSEKIKKMPGKFILS